MNKSIRILFLAALAILLALPAGANNNLVLDNYNAVPLEMSNNLQIKDGGVQLAATQDQASWWNSTFIYRRYFNFTEVGGFDRTSTPVHLYLTFEDGHCYTDSFRVGYYDDPGWTILSYQTWNTTYYPGGEFIQSTRISFMVNVSSSSTDQNYYVYYAKIDVGSVSYPNFYPFIYKSYTYSLINLVSYYDNNNYLVEKWDASSSQWDDPRNFDNRWSAGDVTPNNIPSGTLNEYGVIRYEPTAYSNSPDYFWGFYTIYSNYPLAVSMGQGNIGSNPAINDWFPGTNEMSLGVGTSFILGGIEGFEDRNEGKYWVQATQNNTEVYAWTTSEVADTGWLFHNGSSVASWPATLSAGEYISKRDVIYTSYMFVNSTKPVSVRQGDSDCTYARDIWAFYSAVDGSLAGEEFYTIDMGHSYDYTRVTNLGDTSVQVDWRRNAGSGWGSWTTITINANSSQLIARGTASISDQEDILHIKGEAGSMLMAEGLYNPTVATDAGDWVPSSTGHRFGTNHKLWGINGYKFFIVATENAEVQVSGYNSGTLYLSAGEMSEFRPVSGSMTLYHITSNASVGVVDVGRFSTSSPYGPTGDTGYGWFVPAYTPEVDQFGFQIDIGEERNLFELDITVEDLDGIPVEGVSVALYNASTVWEDDQGNNRTGITDSNGLVIFEGLNNGTYEVHSIIDAASWLSTSASITNVWITDTSSHSITGSVTPVTITLNIASLSVHLEDLMGASMDDTLDEDIYMRLCNDSSDDSIYLHQAQANSTGWLDFPRIPQDNYYFRAKYTGEHSWNSYGFDDLKQFANWSIVSSDFSLGSWTISDWVLPLITLQVHVHSWDDQLVPNAYIQLNNTVDELAYTMTESSDADGNYTFNRIVNGTWQLNVWRDDDFGQTVVNNTNEVVLSNLQAYTSFEVQLRLTKLNINVITQTGSNNVPDATVTVYLNNQTAIAFGQTDSSGNIVFEWIQGNMTVPWNVWYTVDVVKGTGNVSRYTVKADSNYAFMNVITLPDPTYSPAYTALTSSASFETQNWYLDYIFTIDYFNRTGSEPNPPDTNVTYDGSTLIMFEIWLDTTLVGTGNWTTTTNSFMSKNPNNSTFTITIDLDFWGLNANETAYKIVITAHTTGYNDPDTMVVYLTVLNGETTYGSSTAGITDYYGSHSEYLFWLTDDLNGNVNLTSLDVYNFTIKLGLDVLVSGYLFDNGDGTYSLLSGPLNGLDVGQYVLVIELDKLNYDSVTTEMTITVNDVPMAVSSISIFSYDWALGTQDCTFEYIFDPDNSTNPDLSSVTVVIQWFTGGVSYLNVSTTLSASSGTFTYTFSKNLLPVGQWNLTITCSKDNYATATGTIGGYITVSSAPTTLVHVGDNNATVNWLEDAVFEVTFTRDDDAAGLTGASYTHNWTGIVSFVELGGGSYRVTLDTSIAAATYGLLLTLSTDNHVDSYVEMTITILIPLLIETDYGSIENPLEAYWTANFTIEITLMDQSRSGTPITGATVTYDWFLQFVVDLDGPLSGYSGGIYNITLNANDAVPLDELYTITITANYPGSTQDSTTVFVNIRAVPNEIVLDTEYFEQYYADVFDVRFYWNNTLDGAAIDSFDLSEFNLITLGTLILTGVNEGNGWYHFTVDTKALAMNANEQGSVYVIQITMTQSGFEPHDFTAIIILVRETDASLIVDSIDDTYWSDTIYVSANLFDDLHGGYIWESAVITLSYGTSVVEMTNHLNGTFTVNIVSSDWFAAAANPYELTFTYALPNYVDSVNVSAVIIDPIEGAIIFDVPGGDSLSYTWTESFVLGVRVNQIYGTVQPLLGTDVFYIWSGYSTLYQLTYQPSTFDYDVSVDTADVPAGSYNLIIRVVNENYTIADVEIPIEIKTVNTALSTDILEYEVLASETGLDIYLEYMIDDDDVSLSGTLSDALIVMEYAGTIYTATYQSGTGLFRLTFNPSEMDTGRIPGVFTLNITASLANYTTLEIHPTLRLIAPTTLSGPAVISEETLTFTIWFQFLSPLTGESIGPDQVTSLTLTTPVDTFTLDDFEYNGTHYSIQLESVQIGPVRAEAYELILSASATGFEEQVEQVILVTVTEQTVDVLGLGFVRIPMSLFTTIVTMFSLFLIVVVSAVGIQRWRVPFQIKQINKALKNMQNNKIAKVEGIKSMGDVVSELLAPGLAELDISAPTIDVSPEADFALLGDDTEGLLGELDALDDIGLDETVVDDPTDYEAELEAELDSEIEETPEDVVDEPEVEVAEAESADIVEEDAEEVELDAEVLVTEEEINAMAEKLLALGVAKEEVEFLIENAQSFTKPELEALVSSLELKQLELEKESEDERSKEDLTEEDPESESIDEDVEATDNDSESSDMESDELVEEAELESETGESADGAIDELKPMDEERESSEE